MDAEVTDPATACHLPQSVTCSLRRGFFYRYVTARHQSPVDGAVFPVPLACKRHNDDGYGSARVLAVFFSAARLRRQGRIYVAPSDFGLAPPIVAWNRSCNNGELSEYHHSYLLLCHVMLPCCQSLTAEFV